MSNKKFYVGQRVRIRQWDDMEAEFGTHHYNQSIKCHNTFSAGMKPLCGKIATISKICSGKEINLHDFQNCEGINTSWCYSTDMIESANSPTIVIRSDGKSTTAYLKDGHKTVKSAKATCSPADAFDLYIGADIALKRLFDKPVNSITAEAINPKFDIGDKVKVTNKGETCFAYSGFVKKHAPQLIDRFSNGKLPNVEHEFIVIRRGMRENLGTIAYIIMDAETLQIYVIGEDGLESAE